MTALPSSKNDYDRRLMMNTPVFLANNPAENGIYQKRVIAVNFNSENISFFNRQVRYLSLNGIMVFSYDSTESTLGFMKPAKNPTLPKNQRFLPLYVKPELQE
jgi:hypothetical protein